MITWTLVGSTPSQVKRSKLGQYTKKGPDEIGAFVENMYRANQIVIALPALHQQRRQS
jgi:hypothetical protein